MSLANGTLHPHVICKLEPGITALKVELAASLQVFERFGEENKDVPFQWSSTKKLILAFFLQK